LKTGIANISLTNISQLVREKVRKEDGWFDHSRQLYSFAVAVHLKQFPDGDLAKIGEIDNSTGLAVNTFDPNGYLEKLVRIFRPNADAVNDTLQNWINSGLEIMHEKYKESGRFDLNDFYDSTL
jgi:hypothetical protein